MFGSRELRVRLRDDGRGLEPDVMKAGGRALHWGLPGMRERAARVGAQLDLRSSPETGTEIELRVAAEIAYAKAVPAGRPKSWSRTADRLLDHHG